MELYLFIGTMLFLILGIAGFFKVDCENGVLHLWAGPMGVHLCWPDIWNSRPDWCSNWWEEVE